MSRRYVSRDYARTLYIRTHWSTFNPAEGVYGWDTNEKLKKVIQGALDRGMRLSFRVVVDSRDRKNEATPVGPKSPATVVKPKNSGRWRDVYSAMYGIWNTGLFYWIYTLYTRQSETPFKARKKRIEN